MKILVLNGSPRPNGNTAGMAAAFAEGARESGHEVHIIWRTWGSTLPMAGKTALRKN